MTKHQTIAPLGAGALAAAADRAADRAARAIPPLWPLASSVAVNPYLGQTGERLAETGARLARVAGLPVTMPRAWYLERIESGAITEDDLAAALAAAPAAQRPESVAALRAAAAAPAPKPEALPTVADLAAEATGVDWPGLIAERLGAWAAGYFDEGQALWAAPRSKSAYAEWRAVATHDLTPEIAGLKGFARHVADAPETARDALARATAALGLEGAALDTYFHQMLMTLGGWAQFARFRLWSAELRGETDATVTDLLAIRLIWEEALHGLTGDAIAAQWEAARAAHAAPVAPTPDLVVDEILQEAAERAAQRGLVETMAAPAPAPSGARPALQAAFCIDVRSEIFRRTLEAVDPSIETLGFGGFFAVFASHNRFASDVMERRLPVLLNPGVHSVSGGPESAEQDQAARFARRAKRAWNRFKFAAVSSFAFVEAMGPVYAGKLVRDALGLNETRLPNEPAPRFEPALDAPERIAAAETVLRAMSFTEGFARLVVIAGHGANVTNNPHASALHCGACGGYSGEVNARLLAGLLNDPAVRAGLAEKGIAIPADTLFVAALHDTTTDAVLLYDGDVAAESHAADLEQARAWFEAAGAATRAERALRLPRADGDAAIAARARDWAEVRPEWALAGCKAFIAAPRGRTAGRSLEGRAFLHEYEWGKDEGFGILELIMKAPMVVASWISLQYYGSVTAPSAFGAGDKLLHNVTGGIGVVEGNGGLLRAGLPWQSVHDGEGFQHEPLRLSVCIEAPREAMTDVLERNADLRALFDNRWLHLFALDAAGRIAWRYAGDLAWTEVAAPDAAPARLAAAE
jgi:uncharacterized protein YbcC (UPF0753/DUF2309 family)